MLQSQASQAHRVLQIAFRWREYLRTNGVRNFITALAQDTLNSFGDNEDAWPFCDLCSSFQAINEGGIEGEGLQVLVPEVNISQGIEPENIQDDPTLYYDDKFDKAQALVESAMGAKIAFLVHASQTIMPACIASGRFGCLTASDCCAPANLCSSTNECQVRVD